MNEQDMLAEDDGYLEWLDMMDQAWWTRMEEQLEESEESTNQ